MQYRKLGYTELCLSTIGLGTWAIGGGGYAFGWGPQDDKESIRSIHEALDLGINWIDTAPIYGLGHSEKVVGRAVKGRNDVIIATKCSLLWNEKRKMVSCLKKESIKKEVNDSLKRLKRDVIDLYQIHWPEPPQDIEEAWGFMMELIKEGKIRYAGVSNFNIEQLNRAQSIGPIASLQPPYSLLVRDIEDKILDYCKTNNIGVVAYSTLQSGLLTGKFTPENILELPKEDWRRTKNIHFQEPELTINLKLIENLRLIAEKNGKTVSQLAIAWAIQRLEVTSAIVGARHPGQIKETAKAADWMISSEDNLKIKSLLKERDDEILSKKR